tara:strand:- start:857 stop:1681 length:825 start_codon:yes stop_codon:yes gene_type:complete
MNNFLYEKKHIVVLVFLLSLSFTLITLSIRSRDKLAEIEKTILFFVSPILKVSNIPKEWTKDLWKNYLDLKDFRKENVKIKKQLHALQNIQKKFWELKSEISRLHTILKVKEEKGFKYHTAKVIGKEKNVFSKTVLIGKGRKHNIKQNMIVINSQGLVGRIDQSHLYTSRVLLITDPRSPVHVRVQRTRTQGVFSMINTTKGIVEFVSKDSDILPGDLLITSGLGEIFPKGIYVGYVVKSKNDSSFKKLIVEPAVNFNKLEELKIMEEIKGKLK